MSTVLLGWWVAFGSEAAEPAAPAPAPAPSASPAPAPAPTPAPAPAAPAPASGSDIRVGGKVPPPLPTTPRSAASPRYEPPDPDTYADYGSLPFPQTTYLGAKYLQLDPAFVFGVQQGLEYLYLRRYTEARDHFGRLDLAFPGTAVRSIGDMLVWQALMLENFDFRYDKQYWTSSKQAKKDLTTAIASPGSETWDHLAMAAVTGIESIHTMRQGGYLSALQLAFGAIDEIEKCRAAAPDFVDLKLADGLYNYWRSIITRDYSKVLPDFGDHRTEGIQQMETVQDQGVFMAPLASFALTFTWIEEKDWFRATSACARNRRNYPDNVVNNLTCATIYTYDRKFPEALQVLDRVSSVDSTNTRVHYLRGWVLLRQGDLPKAETELKAYLGSQYLEPYQRSYGLLRLGQVYARQSDFPKAVESYQAAVKVDGNKEAKAAIEKLEEKRKEGKAEF